MKKYRWFTTSVISSVLALMLTSLIWPLPASSSPWFRAFRQQLAASPCGDYEFNRTQERVYFKDKIEYIGTKPDGTLVLEYAQQAAYYYIDPNQTPRSVVWMLSRAQAALSQGTAVYTTASIADADNHVIHYLGARKDPKCIPE